jgi:hypothetical protein
LTFGRQRRELACFGDTRMHANRQSIAGKRHPHFERRVIEKIIDDMVFAYRDGYRGDIRLGVGSYLLRLAQSMPRCRMASASRVSNTFGL